MRRFMRMWGGASPPTGPRTGFPKIRVGLCAMNKKVKSKPMLQILSRLESYGEFDIVTFTDDQILNKPIEEWPIVDILISWFSDGFPLKKAQQYVALRNVPTVNDLPMQDVLLNRAAVYRTLLAAHIPVPTHIIVDRTGLPPGEDPEGFIEDDDFVELNGQRISKPFVEKPFDGEDHGVHIYYPASMGGGVKRLFRKVDNKSSQYDPNHDGRVRRDGSYIIEEFLATGGTDVKVYTVGPRYAHAEARKSPVVDGKVLRTADGKEMRFPVLLSPQEKDIAFRVVNAFKQNICGFDLLRSSGGEGSVVSYVCDVNGWSFVKNSRRYYDDAAGILRSIILEMVNPSQLEARPNPQLPPAMSFSQPCSALLADMLQAGAPGGGRRSGSGLEDEGVEDEDELPPGWDLSEAQHTEERSKSEELRCVLAVVRHGDRTPKQKLKLKVTAPPLLALFQKHKDAKGKQAKLKKPDQLQELLDTTRELLRTLERDEAAEMEAEAAAAAAAANAGAAEAVAVAAGEAAPPALLRWWGLDREAATELREKLRVVRTVLEQAAFAGVNRKVQMKPTRWGSGSAAAGSHSNNSGGGIAAAPAAHVASAPALGEPLSPSRALAAQAQRGVASTGSVAAMATQSNGENTSTSSSAPDVAAIAAAAAAAAPREDGTPVGPGLSGGGGAGGGLPRCSSRSSVASVASSGPPVLEEVLLILKWGGVLTHAGRQQAEDLGKVFRMVMYPSHGSAGGGLLRLHSTYRHDLKIYSSDEGRVQASAAAFAKGLLDLEGTSLTPILVSLVNKDASMLDAFGKGASDDIKQAKQLVYAAMTWDPEQAASEAMQCQAPGPTPPQTSRVEPPSVPTPPLSSQEGDLHGKADGQQAEQGLSPQGAEASTRGQAAGEGEPLGAEADTVAVPAPPPGLSEALSSRSLPASPLRLLRRLHELLRALVLQLRALCLRADVAGGTVGGTGLRYSSLSQEPAEWKLVEGCPCSGEQMLLMFDRWNKLAKSFFSEKSGQFDISKVPDIYDSAKYDSVHNRHLLGDDCECLRELYTVAKRLAHFVIPSEYGVSEQSKLHIGAKICGELLGKLLMDLAAMREESRAITTETNSPYGDAAGLSSNSYWPPPRLSSVGEGTGASGVEQQNGKGASEAAGKAGEGERGAAGTAAEGQQAARAEGGGEEGAGEEGGHGEEAAERLSGAGQQPQVVTGSETIYRLAPELATCINSPLRHVRTRVYFTSESHVHSLVNVLRLAHTHSYHTAAANLAAPAGPGPATACGPDGGPVATAGSDAGLGPGPSIPPAGPVPAPEPLLSPSALEALENTGELDYLTHVVFRMYEDKARPLDSPQRFRLEVLFSPGASHDVFDGPPRPDHTFAPQPRVQMQGEQASGGITLEQLEATLGPMAQTAKFAMCSSTYTLQTLGGSGVGLAGAGGSAVGLSGAGGGSSGALLNTSNSYNPRGVSAGGGVPSGGQEAGAAVGGTQGRALSRLGSQARVGDA